MAVLILKHNALTPYANFEGAKAGIVEKMNGAQQGELWAAEYFTSTEGDLNNVKGAILAFKGKNGIVTFADSDNVSEEMKTSLADYYTKTEIDELVENVTNNAIGIAEGDGIAIEGEGTIKTISANLDLNIVTVEGKEMLQLVDGSDNSKVIAEVDASAFVVDGMLSSAEIITVDDETELPEGVELSKGKYIKLSWNTDSGKSDTYVPVADLISEHKVVAGEDVAGEFVVVTTNVVESTDENSVKVSTVNVTVDDSAVKSALDTKIGKDDIMLDNKQVIILDDEENSYNGYTFEYLSDNWELSFKTYRDYNYEGIIINVVEDQLFILTNEETKDKIKIVCNNGVISVYKDNELQPETGIFKPGKLFLSFLSSFVGEITLQEGLPLNTKSSLEYLNKNKADKNEVESSIAEVEYTFNADLGTKVGKYDTVLSVNDGETNTDYNVEGALEYLNNEIKAMTVIDCGVF